MRIFNTKSIRPPPPASKSRPKKEQNWGQKKFVLSGLPAKDRKPYDKFKREQDCINHYVSNCLDVFQDIETILYLQSNAAIQWLMENGPKQKQNWINYYISNCPDVFQGIEKILYSQSNGAIHWLMDNGPGPEQRSTLNQHWINYYFSNCSYKARAIEMIFFSRCERAITSIFTAENLKLFIYSEISCLKKQFIYLIKLPVRPARKVESFIALLENNYNWHDDFFHISPGTEEGKAAFEKIKTRLCELLRAQKTKQDPIIYEEEEPRLTGGKRKREGEDDELLKHQSKSKKRKLSKITYQTNEYDSRVSIFFDRTASQWVADIYCRDEDQLTNNNCL